MDGIRESRHPDVEVPACRRILHREGNVMAVFRRNGDGPDESVDTAPPGAGTRMPAPATARRPPHRGRGARVGAGLALLMLVVFVVLVLQNTRDVEVRFLSFDGRVPLSLPLLLAGVSAGVVALAATALRRRRGRSQARN